jgi:hypothetical protein
MADGLKIHQIKIAPDADLQHSKRYASIKNEDQNLSKNLNDLEDGTIQRNRAYQLRLVSTQ